MQRSGPLELVVAAVLGVTTLAHAGCESEGCLRGEQGCEVPSACQALAFTCADPTVELAVMSAAAQGPGGLDAMGAAGDWLLRNAEVEVVIDGLDHPTHFGVSGGGILDLANRDRDDDNTNHVVQVVGALPTDAVTYARARTIEGDGFVALQLEGHLVGDERQRVYTRYELRACEPGVRVRTEIVNGGDDVVVWSNADGTFWGGRSMLVFTPSAGEGYYHPSFGLGTLNDVVRDTPFVVGTSHSTSPSAVAFVPCNVETVTGFHSGQVSTSGTPRRIVAPRDYEVFERFIAVRPGAGAAPGVDVALELRRQLFAEPFSTITGAISLAGGRVASLGDHARASVMLREGALGDLPETMVPWTEVVPGNDGSFRARVPSSRSYVVQVIAFGAVQAEQQVDVGSDTLDIGTIEIAAAGEVTLDVTVDGVPDHAQVLFHPADDDTAAAVTSQYFEQGVVCAPLLGPPNGGSPACNRVLVDAQQTIDVPPGSYDVFATAGLFASVARASITVLPGEAQTVTLQLTRLAPPPGALSADFHVHGAASFDSTIPDLDRVRAFLAAGVDVIAATDHDAVWDYAAAMQALHADDRMVLLSGLETTGLVLFPYNPSVYFPQVIGHWNFWPVPFDDDAPRNGAPWDELCEPGTLFGRVAERGFSVADGVIQLNHPWADSEFARDLGYLRALGVRLDEELPRAYDGSGPSLVLRTPPGSSWSNADYHTQEVMNGTENGAFLPYRAVWHWLLDQGIARAGTANSDSHSLHDSILGTPRNVVTTATTLGNFDELAFNADVKAGRMIGTNGPIIEATLESGPASYRPSILPIAPSGAPVLHVRVRAPAWVPVKEVRVLVNGEPLIIGAGELTHPDDPFAAIDVLRLDRTIPLADLLPSGTRDAWIVVEAGDQLPRTGDLDCDLVPDTTDNNGDGVVDWTDVDRNGDHVVDALDVEGREGPEPCRDDYGKDASADRPAIGPLRNPSPPARDDPAYPFVAVTPGGYPLAFTNPFLLDRDGNGSFDGPGLRGAP
ncbi:MAG: CehA/McbA family metallohydrolase [Deltaproteobacteria bacterium]|nr:CehA/McbA family metallohydrolase [Deltaproteobacteria bacterium]